MDLKPGDRVKTQTGQVGNVVHISRLTVFVAIAVPGKVDRVEAFLESQLEKVADPGKGSENPPNPNAGDRS